MYQYDNSLLLLTMIKKRTRLVFLLIQASHKLPKQVLMEWNNHEIYSWNILSLIVSQLLILTAWWYDGGGSSSAKVGAVGLNIQLCLCLLCSSSNPSTLFPSFLIQNPHHQWSNLMFRSKIFLWWEDSLPVNTTLAKVEVTDEAVESKNTDRGNSLKNVSEMLPVLSAGSDSAHHGTVRAGAGEGRTEVCWPQLEPGSTLGTPAVVISSHRSTQTLTCLILLFSGDFILLRRCWCLRRQSCLWPPCLQAVRETLLRQR